MKLSADYAKRLLDIIMNDDLRASVREFEAIWAARPVGARPCAIFTTPSGAAVVVGPLDNHAGANTVSAGAPLWSWQSQAKAQCPPLGADGEGRMFWHTAIR